MALSMFLRSSSRLPAGKNIVHNLVDQLSEKCKDCITLIENLIPPYNNDLQR